MHKRMIALLGLIALLTMSLAACDTANNTPADGDDDLPPVAAVRAQEALAAELGLNTADVTIVSQEQTTWSDSCLGLGGIAESCLAEELAGWRVELAAGDETYVARTDDLGEQVRFEE